MTGLQVHSVLLVVAIMYAVIAQCDAGPSMKVKESATHRVGTYNMKRFTNYMLEDANCTSVPMTSSQDPAGCLMECFLVGCKTFNYGIPGGSNGLLQNLCQLCTKDLFHGGTGLRRFDDYYHYTPQTPCLEQRACVTDRHQCVPNYEDGDYSCVCADGYHGELCLPLPESESAPTG